VFQLNTRGSAEDFPNILEGLRSELEPHAASLCEECQRRLNDNVLRVLDCKNPACGEIVEGLPPLTTWMAEDSVAYFDEVRRALDAFGVPYVVNKRLVRGLDYYQHSIWEVTSDRLGAQDALAGGGRYRMQASGKTIEGVGFGIGLERAILALDVRVQQAMIAEQQPLISLVALSEAARSAQMLRLTELRAAGLRVRMDLTGKSLKAQMKAAARHGASWVVVLGDDELAQGVVQLRDMESGEQQAVPSGQIIGQLHRVKLP
jgi:histidyl-tRNA synthetase